LERRVQLADVSLARVAMDLGHAPSIVGPVKSTSGSATESPTLQSSALFVAVHEARIEPRF